MTIETIPVGMLGTNCYVLASREKRCAVIDPGAQPDKIIREIEKLGCEVMYVLLTHGHHDHIGGVKKLISAYPAARLKIGGEDIEMLGDTQKSLAIFRQTDDSDFVIGNAETVSEGDVISVDELEIKVLETPGHTKGGVTYFCADALFTGDTLFREDVGRTDLYGGDYEVLKASLAKIAAIKRDCAVYPGHGESSNLEYEKRNNDYLNGSAL